ncbi:MAG: hypothetical protein D6795_00795 [Deltaproteobacteria bacterium]|nr:MAG: hypothetical protein D6795_00795 [Deltaproteobacteria bacterium]
MKPVKEGNLPLLVFIVFLTISALGSLIFIYLKHQQRVEVERVPADDTIELRNVRVTIEELGNFTITGTAVNHSDEPRRDIIVKFALYNDKGERVTTITHMLGVRKYLTKDEPENFVIIGEEAKRWSKLRYYVESFIPVTTTGKSPVPTREGSSG